MASILLTVVVASDMLLHRDEKVDALTKGICHHVPECQYDTSVRLGIDQSGCAFSTDQNLELLHKIHIENYTAATVKSYNLALIPQFRHLRIDRDILLAIEGTSINQPECAPSSIKASRIEFNVRRLTIGRGDEVRSLSVNLYDGQNILSDELAAQVVIHWSDNQAGGTFHGYGRIVDYTAPDIPGTYTITAQIDDSQCNGDANECQTELEIQVDKLPTCVLPELPYEGFSGFIPLFHCADVAAYEVFSHIEGGQYIGDGFSLVAPHGAVKSGEIIGILMQKGEVAANVEKIDQRYTIAGSWYNVDAVDIFRMQIMDYHLNSPAEICVPLPEVLRTNISDATIVALNTGDRSLTMLSSHVRLRSDADPELCGNLSRLPVSVAAGKLDTPHALTTPAPSMTDDEQSLPQTGGSPIPVSALALAITLGASALVIGKCYARSK